MAEVRKRNVPDSAQTPVNASSTPKQTDETTSTSPSGHADSFLDAEWQWSRPSSWPWSIRLLPVVIAGLAVVFTLAYDALLHDPGMKMSDFNTCARTFNYTFPINDARVYFAQNSTRDWEFGAAAEAGLELLDRDKSVFGPNPFPKNRIPNRGSPLGVQWAKSKMWTYGPTLFYNEESYTDPAALGVFAVMLSAKRMEFAVPATRQKETLLESATRYSNGAISSRERVAELWSDAIFMFPPFLAYYAVYSDDIELMKEAVRQCELYRDVLLIKSGDKKGLWKHVVGPSDQADAGAWSTGNAWAAYGMARVRATVAGWEPSREVMQKEIQALDGYIAEIIDGAIRTDTDASGLLRNYLGDKKWFGEASGTALLAAAAYRLGTFTESESARERYLEWAHSKRRVVYRHTNDDGVVAPVVNPYAHTQTEPLDGSSPEGQSFLWILAAAWRDCVCSGTCQPDAEQFDHA